MTLQHLPTNGRAQGSRTNERPSELREDLRALKEQEREVGALIADMWENGEKLARQEIALGIAELQVRADKLKVSLAEGAVMGAVANAAMLLLLAAAVLGLSEVMAPWLAALIVGVAALAVTYVLKNRAVSNANQAVADTDNPRTQRTVRAMKEAIK